MDQLLREPFNAAVAAAAITVGYIYIKNKMNGDTKVKNSEYFKPAFLIAILVYFLTNKAHGSHESRMTEPY